MGFKSKLRLSSVTAALLIVISRFLQLILTPYKTMRKISLEEDRLQLGIIFAFVLMYFLLSGFSKFFVFLVLFSFTVFFYYYLGRIFDKKTEFSSIVSTFSYALFPTLIWFYTNYLLFLLLPPPRTPSVQGRVFSVVYVSFSLSLLLWKVILTYLAVRFSLKLQFYRTIYSILIYSIFLSSYTYIMYVLGLAKVPFI